MRHYAKDANWMTVKETRTEKTTVSRGRAGSGVGGGGEVLIPLHPKKEGNRHSSLNTL